MAVKLTEGAPEAGREAVTRALRDLRAGASTAELAASALGGAELDLSRPLPIYRLGLDQIEGDDFLDRAEHFGWRYLIEGPHGRMGFADVRDLGGGEPRFASFAENQHADRLSKAAEIAHSLSASLPDEYEARVLDVPALYVSAVWLANENSIFIPYLDLKRLHGADVREEPHFVSELLAGAAVARREAGHGSSERARSR